PLRHCVGEARTGHAAKLVGRLAAEHVVGELGAPHRAEQLADEHRLEGLRRLAQLLAALRIGLPARGGGLTAPAGGGGLVVERIDHRMMSSARSAPACFSASRIATRSDGAAPIAFTARTISDSDAPGAKLNMGERCSVISMVELGTITVWPPDRGRGWLTWGSSCTETVSRPWLTAAGRMRTAPLITTVPVRALTIPRSGASAGSTSTFSIRLINALRTSAPCGTWIATETPSSARAMGWPTSSLIAWAM